MTIHQPIAGSGTSRSARFLARVDAQIAPMNTATRKAYLVDQISVWEHLYSAFLETEGKSMPVSDPFDPPQAADFTMTIAGLQQRYGRT